MATKAHESFKTAKLQAVNRIWNSRDTLDHTDSGRQIEIIAFSNSKLPAGEVTFQKKKKRFALEIRPIAHASIFIKRCPSLRLTDRFFQVSLCHKAIIGRTLALRLEWVTTPNDLRNHFIRSSSNDAYLQKIR